MLLETDGIQSGYIIISTDLNDNLFQEYSDYAWPICFQTGTDSGENINSRGQKRIYYSRPLQYGYEKPDSSGNESVVSLESPLNGDRYEKNYELLLSLQEVGKMITRSSGSGSYITLPYQYLMAQNPNKKYHFDESFRIPFDGYDINGWNACSVYAIAAVLHHHLKYIDGIDFDTRANRCKEIAVEKGYAEIEGGSINYHIFPGSLKPLADACIAYFNADLTVDSHMIGTWNTTKNEVENRRPVIVNIWSAPSSNYVDHSVVAYGWSLWNDESGGTYRFLLVRDGREITEDRYVDYESIGIHYITKIY